MSGQLDGQVAINAAAVPVIGPARARLMVERGARAAIIARVAGVIRGAVCAMAGGHAAV